MNKFVKKIKHLIRKNKGKLSTYTGVYHTWSEAKSNSTQLKVKPMPTKNTINAH